MKLLITGCGKSGTHWIARCLTLAGVPCKHEEHFTPERAGVGNWAEWTAEASWCAAPHTPLEGVHVVHLVRHPLDVVRSRVDSRTFEVRFTTGSEKPYLGPWATWAYRWCPGMKLYSTPVEKAAIHWVQWNRLVVADEVLRLEDVDGDTITRLARIVDPEAPGILECPPPTNATDDDRRSARPEWEELEHVPGFVETARRLGYDR